MYIVFFPFQLICLLYLLFALSLVGLVVDVYVLVAILANAVVVFFAAFPSIFTAEMVVCFLIVSCSSFLAFVFQLFQLLLLLLHRWRHCRCARVFSVWFLISSFGFYAVIACCRYDYIYIHIDINISAVRSCHFLCALNFFLVVVFVFYFVWWWNFFSPFFNCC